MAILERSTIHDGNGRRITVERRAIAGRAKPIDLPTLRADGPRNARELATLLEDLSHDARRIPPSGGHNPNGFHEAKSELAHKLDGLSAWARRQCF